MTHPSFADTEAAARTLTVVRAEGLADWLAAQPGPVQAWLKGTGFEAGLGEVRLLAGPDGTVQGAVAGFGTAKARARMRFGLARAVVGLPAGNWRLAGDLAAARMLVAVAELRNFTSSALSIVSSPSSISCAPLPLRIVTPEAVS